MSARADRGPPILEASPVDSDGPNSMVVRKGRWSMKRQSGAKAMALAVILFSTPLIWSSARADLLSLSFATIATAVDTGQQDGIFDLFALSNLGSLINSGFTSFSTAAEFHLSSVPAGAILNSATLTSLISNIPFENCPAFCVDRSIEVLGYAGDGAIQLADFGNGGVVGSSVIGVGNINPAHDVTSFINGLRSSGTAFAGFNAGCQIQD
jgi:hypothetical protein